ncbi:MAG: cation transporter, partial [Gammaproteobacteria bacterium]|nr:cation transporter [Gammaproteobacteria bacterium]
TILDSDDRIITVNEVATLHMGPDFIVVTISVDFVDALSSGKIEEAVTQLNRTIKATDPRIKRVFIEAERQLDHQTKVT